MTRPIPTSPWVCIANIPPLSSLDDIIRELTRVLDAELQRGIVDLDEAERMLEEASAAAAADADGSARVGISPEENAAAWNDEDWDGATAAATTGLAESVAGEEHVDEGGGGAPSLPLWNPPPTKQPNGTTPTTTSARDLILEARLLLSILGRPLGWYVRLPNRSVVHALLTHAEEARERSSTTTAASVNGGGGGQEATTTATATATAAAPRPLSCGNRILDIGEFVPPTPPPPPHHPHPPNPSRSRDDHHPNSQSPRGRILSGRFFRNGHLANVIETSFDRAVATPPSSAAASIHGGGGLRLDDTVLRVENCPVGSDVDDVRYLFRRYDLADTRLPERRVRRGELDRGGSDDGDGGDGDDGGDEGALADVELLVKGNSRLNERHNRRKRREGGGGEEEEDGDDQAGGGVRPIAMTNTFLVRFETAADARAAIRDMQMVEYMGRKLRLAQYPRQLLVDD